MFILVSHPFLYPFPGCASVATTLPDMRNSCKYRQCVVGKYPWIDLDGKLQISTTDIACPAGSGVPTAYVSGTEVPCTEQNTVCAGMTSDIYLYITN